MSMPIGNRDQVREEAWKLFSSGRNNVEVASSLGISETTARRWKREWSGRPVAVDKSAMLQMENAALRAQLKSAPALQVEGYGDDEPCNPKETWDRYVAANAKKIERSLAQQQFKIKMDTNRPIGICFVSDQHISGDNCIDLKQMQADAEFIASTPGIYAVLGGDGIDNHCLDEESQVLTKRGWMEWWQLQPDDHCLGVDDTMKSVWQPIERVISSDYSGEMVRVKTESLDMLLTPGHRFAYRSMDRVGRPSGVLKYIPAGDLCSGTKQVLVAADQCQPDLPGISDAELKVVGLILTDGWISQPKRSCGNRRFYIAQRLSNSAYVAQALDEAGIVYGVSRRSVEDANRHISTSRGIVAREEMLTFCILAESSARLSELLERKVPHPEWVSRLSKRQFLVLLEAIIEGDGSYNGRGFILYGVHSFLDAIQAECVAHGIAARKVDYHRSQNDGRLLICPHKSYQQVCVRRCVSREEYSGKVWCLNVPTGNFIARRRGGVFLTGNCKHRAAILAARTTPDDQLKLFDYYLQIFADKIAVMISGNHDMFSTQLAGVDVVRMLAEKNRVRYSPHSAFIEWVVGKVTYRVCIAHQYRFNSAMNQTHSPKQMLNFGEYDFDIGVVCHNHEPAHESFRRRGLDRWVARPGAYQVYSDYSAQYGYPTTRPTCPTVVVYPNERKLVGFGDVRDAAIFLGAA